jgi:hypothetical protein
MMDNHQICMALLGILFDMMVLRIELHMMLVLEEGIHYDRIKAHRLENRWLRSVGYRIARYIVDDNLGLGLV